MNIEGVQPWKILSVPMLNETLRTDAASAAGEGFQKMLLEGLHQINHQKASADQMAAGFLEGNGPALHTVMLNIEQANLGLEMAVQVRNKFVEAYQEIMRMQI